MYLNVIRNYQNTRKIKTFFSKISFDNFYPHSLVGGLLSKQKMIR